MRGRSLVLFVVVLAILAGCTPSGGPAESPQPPPAPLSEPPKPKGTPLGRFRESHPTATIIKTFEVDLNQDGKTEVALSYTLPEKGLYHVAVIGQDGELLWAPSDPSVGAPSFQTLHQGADLHLVVIQYGFPNLVYLLAMPDQQVTQLWRGEADETIQIVGDRIDVQRRIYKVEGGYTVEHNYAQWNPAKRTYEWGAPPAEPKPREATLRWANPPQGVDWLPLPSGVLLTTTKKQQPFQLAAWSTDGKSIWSRNWEGTIDKVDLSGDGQRVAVVTATGLVHVLSVKDGLEIAAVQVDLEERGVDEIELIANGQYIAQKRRTASGAVPWVLEVYPVQTGAKPLYGTSGVAVHASPYHASVIGLKESKLTIATPTGSVGPVDYPAQVQIGMVAITSRADGNGFFVRRLQEGVDLVDQNLTHQGQIQLRDLSQFAPVAGLFWRKAEGEQFAIFKSGGTDVVRGPAGETSVASVLPGGEAVVKVEGAERYCVIKPDGAQDGCYPSVHPSPVAVGGRSFYWTVERNGAIAGYVVK
jgi:hypothetical protein